MIYHLRFTIGRWCLALLAIGLLAGCASQRPSGQKPAADWQAKVGTLVWDPAVLKPEFRGQIMEFGPAREDARPTSPIIKDMPVSPTVHPHPSPLPQEREMKWLEWAYVGVAVLVVGFFGVQFIRIKRADRRCREAEAEAKRRRDCPPGMRKWLRVEG
jgi:hypothetical protein